MKEEFEGDALGDKLGCIDRLDVGDILGIIEGVNEGEFERSKLGSMLGTVDGLDVDGELGDAIGLLLRLEALVLACRPIPWVPVDKATKYKIILINFIAY